MRYLYGDSTESNLEFNYLSFLRQALDCSVLLVKHKLARVSATARRKAREQEVSVASKSLEEMRKEIAANFSPLAKEMSPIGRVASTVIAAANEAIEREAAKARSVLAAEIEKQISEDRADRMRCLTSLENLLCTHDLPASEMTYEIVWKETVKAHVTARAKYAAAMLSLDVAQSSVFTPELRVDRLVDGIEIHALEESGWLKKSNKLVPHKIGRWVITRVLVGAELTKIRLRAMPDTTTSIEITVPKTGDISVERIGDQGLREPCVDGKYRSAVWQLADKLAVAARAIEKRTALVALDIEGKPFLEHQNPSVLAERLVELIAPVMQKIAKHSRHPDELVLRRQLGDDRREEIFVSMKELSAKLDSLPAEGRAVFAPLGLVPDVPPPDPVRKPPPPLPIAPARTRHSNSTVELDSADDLLLEETEAREPVQEAKEPVVAMNAEEPVVSMNAEEPVVELKSEEPAVEPKPEDPIVETKPDEPVIEAKPEEPVIEMTPEDPVLATKADEPVLEMTADEPVIATKPEEPVTETKLDDSSRNDSVTTPMTMRPDGPPSRSIEEAVAAAFGDSTRLEAAIEKATEDAAEPKPAKLPRALIIESGEFAPLPKPDTN